MPESAAAREVSVTALEGGLAARTAARGAEDQKGATEWAEYRRLFAAHGFRLTRVVPTAGDVSVVEGRPD